jgi:S1-C subfamily serine protease
MSLLLMIFVIRALVGSPVAEEAAPRAAANELAAVPAAAPRGVATELAAVPAAPPERAEPIETAAAEPEPPRETVRSRPASAGNGAALTTAEIVARCEPSVALIKGRVSSGTGFVIKRGIVATNAHVIEEELLAGLEIRFPGAPGSKQGPLPAQLLYEDRKRDVAFLAVQTDLPALELAPNYAFQKGEDVTVIGNPGMGEDVVLENAISRGVMSSKTVIEGMNYYQMNIAINPGNSGGPVFDSQGRVIGVATLKSNKAEAMGFCIPVEELRLASNQLSRSHPEMVARHRAVAAFKSLTLAGVLYVVGIVARSGHLQGVDSEGAAKLHETVKSLDAKLFSLIDVEVAGLQHESSLSPRVRRNYQELSANYKAMKQVYGYGPQQVNQYANHIDDLRKQHLNLVVAIRDALQVEVAPKLLSVLQEPLTGNQRQVVVVDVMPPQMQPRFRGGAGMGPRAQIGPRRQGGVNPGQSLHNQLQQRMQQQKQQMENRMRSMMRP